MTTDNAIVAQQDAARNALSAVRYAEEALSNLRYLLYYEGYGEDSRANPFAAENLRMSMSQAIDDLECILAALERQS